MIGRRKLNGVKKFEIQKIKIGRELAKWGQASWLVEVERNEVTKFWVLEDRLNNEVKKVKRLRLAENVLKEVKKLFKRLWLVEDELNEVKEISYSIHLKNWKQMSHLCREFLILVIAKTESRCLTCEGNFLFIQTTGSRCLTCVRNLKIDFLASSDCKFSWNCVQEYLRCPTTYKHMSKPRT